MTTATKRLAKRLGLTALAGLAGMVWSLSAAAAPQALGLVATDRPVVLTCADGVCEAEFSAFCLQQDRVAPEPGTPYRLAGADGNGGIAVTGVARDGSRRDLAAADVLRIVSARSHTAVTLRVDRARLAALGIDGVEVRVAGDVTLAPRPVADDPNPIGETEMALAEQVLRPLGGAVVDRNSEGMAAARIANRLVNSLPYYDGDPAGTARTWNTLMHEARQNGLSPMGERLAKNAFVLCQYYADRVVQGDMKGCMQGQHDRLMKVLNSSFWKAVKTGS